MVVRGIEAAVNQQFGTSSLEGLAITVQSLGHVGQLIRHQLAEAGARLVVADLDEDRVKAVVAQYGAVAADPARIHQANVDVFAPCALGTILNDQTIPQIRANVVVGAANNQLAEDRYGNVLRERGIL